MNSVMVFIVSKQLRTVTYLPLVKTKYMFMVTCFLYNYVMMISIIETYNLAGSRVRMAEFRLTRVFANNEMNA